MSIRIVLQLALILLIGVGPCGANNVVKHTLENKEFGLSARVSAAAVTCTERHGFSILLEPRSSGCKSTFAQPYIAFYGDYNVLQYKNPSGALRLLCSSEDHRPTKDVSDLAFPGHISAVCEQASEDGWVDIFISTLSGRWPDRGTKSETAYIVYTAQLHTRQDKLSRDVKALKAILKTVHLRF